MSFVQFDLTGTMRSSVWTNKSTTKKKKKSATNKSTTLVDFNLFF